MYMTFYISTILYTVCCMLRYICPDFHGLYVFRCMPIWMNLTQVTQPSKAIPQKPRRKPLFVTVAIACKWTTLKKTYRNHNALPPHRPSNSAETACVPLFLSVCHVVLVVNILNMPSGTDTNRDTVHKMASSRTSHHCD